MSDAKKWRPILFSGPMVQAILSGRKTQTRRLIKPHRKNADGVCLVAYEDAPEEHANELWPYCLYGDGITDENGVEHEIPCPFGSQGDRLWVRETFCIESFGGGVAQIRYLADNRRGNNAGISDRNLPNRCGVVPSIHMPRHASRISLEVESIRVERLQDISEEDAIAEGCQCSGVPASLTNRGAFAKLWESINGPGSWEANPWVWVVTFRQKIREIAGDDRTP